MSVLDTGIYSLQELVDHARRHSPFYWKLYRELPESGWSLTDLPIIDQAAFWRANDMSTNKLLTMPANDGFVFKSGGTTGAPKFSVFSHQEWSTFTRAFGRGMAQYAVEPGDRIANLFYAGDLYASFLFIIKSIEQAPVQLLQFPIGGATSRDIVRGYLIDFNINVIAGVPTTILGLAEDMIAAGITAPGIERLLYGGEAFYEDQIPTVLKAFPNAEVRSIGYASVDAGLLGYADTTCKRGEHRAFDQETILEIVDDATGEVIEETGVPGKVVITNLTRKMMPIIRYPAGDRAIWLDPPRTPGRRFLIIGRSDEGARIGPVSLYLQDVRAIVHDAAPRGEIVHFQLVINHHDMRDGLTIRLVPSTCEHANAELMARVRSCFDAARPMYSQHAAVGKVHPLQLAWCRIEDLEVNPRTGKLKLLVDERGAKPSEPVTAAESSNQGMRHARTVPMNGSPVPLNGAVRHHAFDPQRELREQFS